MGLDLKMDLSNDAPRSSNNMESNGLLENYELGNKIGSGSFSTVRIATHILTGHNVAIKILNRSTIKDMKVEDKGMCIYIYSLVYN